MTTSERADNLLTSFVTTGSEIKRLMRKHGWTIRSLSKRFGITQKRIREVRNGDKITGYGAAMWVERLTGSRRFYVLFCLRAGNRPSGLPLTKAH